MPNGETWILKDQLDALQSEVERLRRELAEIKADPFKPIREMGVHDTSCYADPSGLTCVRADGCADDRLPNSDVGCGAAAAQLGR